MHTVTSADGTPIGYVKSGSGPPLVLVHGTTADHTRWTPILPRFEPHFTVYAMDRRGRGGSGDAPAYDLMREAEDVAAVVDAAAAGEDRPVSLLGHSFGALCSLEAALLTGNLGKLVLYEPPVYTGVPFYEPGTLDRVRALIDRGDNEGALETFMRDVVKMPEHELAAYRRLPVWQTRVSLAPTIPREDEYDHSYVVDLERFTGLTVPTLMLQGEDSPAFLRAATAAVHAALPNSRVVVFPGQQHIAMDTVPELFAGEVRKFLLGSD